VHIREPAGQVISARRHYHAGVKCHRSEVHRGYEADAAFEIRVFPQSGAYAMSYVIFYRNGSEGKALLIAAIQRNLRRVEFPDQGTT
jgi:hypothetical protein